MPSIISLTTDFGLSDGYVAAMKGVILGISPATGIVDISHEVPPQDIMHGAFVLSSASRFFPSGSIHVAVVDPGVGTARHPLLLVTPRGAYIAPDNGILTYILLENGARPQATASSRKLSFMETVQVAVPDNCSAYILNRAAYWLEPVSDTFHGRDIFAPAAAHLASGVPPEKLGAALEHVKCKFIPAPALRGNLIRGQIIYEDHFGNLVSNIRADDLVDLRFQVEIEGRRIPGPSHSYESAPALLTIMGSHGYLEVAYRNDSAAMQLEAGVGTPLTVTVIE